MTAWGMAAVTVAAALVVAVVLMVGLFKRVSKLLVLQSAYLGAFLVGLDLGVGVGILIYLL